MIAPISRLALVFRLLQSADFQTIGATPHAHDYFEVRGGLKNSHLRFALAKQARVAFLGGSITSMEGWRGRQRGRLVGLGQAQLGEGWKLDPQWKPAISAGTRAGFVNVPMLVAEQPGATLKFKFEGTAVGIVVVAGPDTGHVAYSIDGGGRSAG